MKRVLVSLLALVAIGAQAQDVSLDLDLSNLLAPTLTWTSTADECSVSWDLGIKPANGSETVPPIRSSSMFGVVCSVAGDSQAVLTWVNPTENDDGSPYTDPDVTRLAWSMDGLGDFDCLDPDASGDNWTDRPSGDTAHTITGLSPGTWEFRAYAVNQVGLCSGPSNTASKETTAGSTVSSSVSISVPGAVGGLGAN